MELEYGALARAQGLRNVTAWDTDAGEVYSTESLYEHVDIWTED